MDKHSPLSPTLSLQDFRSEQPSAAKPPLHLRELSQLRFLKFLPHLLEVWGVVTAAIAVSLIFFPPLYSGVLGIVIYLIAIFLIATRQHAMGVLIHEGIHFRVIENKYLNDWIVRIFLAFPIFISLSKWRFIHFHHHRLTQKEDDPDLAIYARYPLSTKKWRGLLLKDLLGLNILRNQKYFLDIPFVSQDFNQKFLGEKRIALYLKNRDMLSFSLFWLIVLTIGITAGGWAFLSVFFFYWFLPYCTLAQLSFRIRGGLEHGHVPDREDPYQQTRTYLSHPIVSYLVSPKNVHYHLEHHLYPTVPFYRLRELHRILLDSEYKNQKPFVQSFWTSLRDLVK